MLPNDLAKLATFQSQRFTQDFKVRGRIGKGGFSKVFEVENLLDKNVYAIKKIELSMKDIKDNLERTLERVQRGNPFPLISSSPEARYLARLSHTKIIRYFNSWVEVEHRKPPTDAVTKRGADFFKEVNDLSFERPIPPLESPGLSRNDLDQFIVFEPRDNGLPSAHDISQAISYSEIEDDPSQCQRLSRKSKTKKTRPSAQNKKSSSQECKFSEEGSQQIEKIFFFIQTEFCKQTLENYLQARDQELGKLKKKSQEKYQSMLAKCEKEAKQILNQILQGLRYLHQDHKLVHRDLKPGNIFMNSPTDVKIGDFGLVTKIIELLDKANEEGLESPVNSHCTMMYASPEQMNSKSFDQRSDIYSLGIIILQLYHPMSTAMELVKTINDARKGVLPAALKERKPRIAELVAECLRVDPKQRPNIQRIRDLVNSQEGMSPNDSFSESTGDETALKTIGICEIKFDDEDYVERYVTYNQRQIQIFKSNKHNKAQMIYNVQECTFALCGTNILQVQHDQLVNFQIRVDSAATLHNFYSDLIDT